MEWLVDINIPKFSAQTRVFKEKAGETAFIRSQLLPEGGYWD